MPISRRMLDDEEEVLVDLHPHWVFLLGPALVTAAAIAVAIAVATLVETHTTPVAVTYVLVAVVALPALWLLARIVRWKCISLVVTTTRILYRQGVFSRELIQLRLQRVTEVHYTQTFFERLIRSGKLVVDVEGEQPTLIDDIRRPRVLQRVIARQLDELTVGGRFAGVVTSHEPGTVTSPPPGIARPITDETPPQGVPAPHHQHDSHHDRHDRHADQRPYDGAADLAAPAAQPAAQPAAPAQFPAQPTAAGATATVHDQLVQLDDLRQRGIISEDEFAAKKAELLSRL